MRMPTFRMTRPADGTAATGSCVPALAEQLVPRPGARYDGPVPDEVGAADRGVLTWGDGRPGRPGPHRAAVTLERIA